MTTWAAPSLWAQATARADADVSDFAAMKRASGKLFGQNVPIGTFKVNNKTVGVVQAPKPSINVVAVPKSIINQVSSQPSPGGYYAVPTPGLAPSSQGDGCSSCTVAATGTGIGDAVVAGTEALISGGASQSVAPVGKPRQPWWVWALVVLVVWYVFGGRR